MRKLLFSAPPLPHRALDVALLLFRLHLGLSIADGAGRPKLVSLVSSAGGHLVGPPDWFVQQVAGLGFTFPSPYFWAALAVWGELAGGLLIAFGLLTRWSAAQLAFQFFVVAFIWYEEPFPVVGMYYQQLLFWAFVLVTALGGGRYSLDYLLSRSRQPWAAAPRPGAVAAVAAAAGLWLLTSVAWAGTVHSDLNLAPGNLFVLGGGQPNAFRVAARNVGPVAVLIRERRADGTLAAAVSLQPGQLATLRFAAGSAALLRNETLTPARLSLRISGGTGLGMRSTGPVAAQPGGPDQPGSPDRPGTPGQPDAAPVLRPADLQPLLRADWQGRLSYQDYRSRRPVTLVTRLTAAQAAGGELQLDYQYQEPSGSLVQGAERLGLPAEASRIDWDGLAMQLRQREQLADSTLRLVLEGEGQDDNRPATIRRTVLIAPRRCSIRKEVRFAGQAQWLQRHEYQFTR